MSDDAAASFEPHRRFLVGLAYRMLGSIAEAEDVAQDAFLRWLGADRAAVTEPRAFLARIATRLCLDRKKSAAVRREQYVGTWLPEPVVTDAPPDGAVALAEDVSVALLLTLERLSPLERAAFLLHDVLELDYPAIADALERSEAAVRQLVARGRDHVRDERPRFTATHEARRRLAGAFQAALAAGDIDGIARLLAEDAVFYADGGGKRNAPLNPLVGRDRIVRFLTGIAGKGRLAAGLAAEPVWLNGAPGFVLRGAGEVETIAFEIDGERVAAVYGIRNPDKLAHLARAQPAATA